MDAGLYLPFQPLPLDSRFLYQAAYMMPPFKCLLDISSTEAASWFFIYKLASAEDNSILSIPLAKNLSYSFFFPFPAPPLPPFFFFPKSIGFIYTDRVLTISVAARVGEVPFSIEGPPKCWLPNTQASGVTDLVN